MPNVRSPLRNARSLLRTLNAHVAIDTITSSRAAPNLGNFTSESHLTSSSAKGSRQGRRFRARRRAVLQRTRDFDEVTVAIWFGFEAGLLP